MNSRAQNVKTREEEKYLYSVFQRLTEIWIEDTYICDKCITVIFSPQCLTSPLLACGSELVVSAVPPSLISIIAAQMCVTGSYIGSQHRADIFIILNHFDQGNNEAQNDGRGDGNLLMY